MTINMTKNPIKNDAKWVKRKLDLPALLKKRSHFLLGPRQTGKTSLIRHTLKDVKVYDLLDTSVYLALSQNPGRMAQEINPEERWVVIDEIQRLPELLNEVHRLIEMRGIHPVPASSAAEG
jgi:predicted AAA+ superfamily ATPase